MSKIDSFKSLLTARIANRDEDTCEVSVFYKSNHVGNVVFDMTESGWQEDSDSSGTVAESVDDMASDTQGIDFADIVDCVGEFAGSKI